MSYISVSHVAHISGSCHTHEHVTSHTSVSHATHIKMSRMTHSDNMIRLFTLQGMPHTSVSHVTHINTSRMTRKRQHYSPLDATSHVAHINGSCHTHKWGVHATRQQHRWMASPCHESRRIHQWVMLHTWMTYVWHTANIIGCLFTTRVTMHTSVGHVTYMNELYMTHSNNILCLAMPRVKCHTYVVITHCHEAW